jgi:tetratricopeptide (TPR) repeat protein
MSQLSRAAVASLIAFIIISCASVSGPSGEPRFNPRAIDSRSSLLPSALQVATTVRNFDQRMAFYDRVVSVLVERGDTDGAAAVLGYVSVLLETREETREGTKPQDYLVLARGYLLVDQPEETIEALRRVFEQLRELPEAERRGSVLLEVADIAFAGGEETYLILQELVSAVLVTEDLSLRIRLLARIAEGYASQGAGPAGATLAQQAIPAAESIDNPWLRGVAFSDVAYIFAVTGDTRNREQYFNRVLREMELGRPAVSPEGAVEGLRALRNLLRLDAPVPALQIAELLPGGSIRARGFAEVGLFYAQQDDRPTAFVTFSRAVREASREVNPLRRAEVFRYVAESYMVIDEGQLAELQAMSAVDTLRGTQEDADSAELLGKLLPIYGRDGDFSQVESLLEVLEAAEQRAELLARAAALSLDAGRRDDARRFLSSARDTLGENDADSPEVAILIAGSITRLEGAAAALRYLQTQNDNITVASGLLACARYHPPDEALTDEEAALLEQLLLSARTRRTTG